MPVGIHPPDRLRMTRFLHYSLISLLLVSCTSDWTPGDARQYFKWRRKGQLPVTEPTPIADDDPRLAIAPPVRIPVEPTPGELSEPDATPDAPDASPDAPIVRPPLEPMPDVLGPAGHSAMPDYTRELRLAPGDNGEEEIFSLDDIPIGPAGANGHNGNNGSNEAEDADTPDADDPVSIESDRPDEDTETHDSNTVREIPIEESNYDEEDYSPGTTRVVAATMVQVNGQFITIEDVIESLDYSLANMDRPESEELFRQRVANMLQAALRQKILETLVLTEAKSELTQQHLDMLDEELESIRRDMVAHAGGTEAALRDYYRKRRMDLDDVMDAHRNRLIGQYYLRAQIEPQIDVGPQNLLEYYETHRDEFTDRKRVQMQIIAAPYAEFLPEGGQGRPTPAEWARARQLARAQIDAAAADLEAGGDFTEAVRAYSRGLGHRNDGIWAMMEQGAFKESEIERNAFAIEEGEICGIIETRTCYAIVKALKVEPGRTISFEEAQPQIEAALRDEQYETLMQAYLKKLYDEATIQESDDFLGNALDTLVARYYRELP